MPDTRSIEDCDPASGTFEKATVFLDTAVLNPLSQALARNGIDFGTLAGPLLVERPGSGEPALTLEGYFRLLERISNVTGDEALSLSDRPLLPGALQFGLSQALVGENLEHAMRNIARSFNLLHGGEYNHVYTRDQCIIYEINNNGFVYPVPIGEQEQHSLLECIMILMHFMFVFSTSNSLQKHLVRVRTKRTVVTKPDATSQLGFWGVHVGGKAPGYSLHYDHAAGALPVTLTPESLPNPHSIYGLAAEFVAGQRRDWADISSYSEKVSELLLRGAKSEDEVASKLSMSTRSLRRHLDKENSSFRKLNDKVRKTLAQKLLRGTTPYDVISEQLGYADERSFRPAFLRWNSVTPAEYRKRAQNK